VNVAGSPPSDARVFTSDVLAIDPNAVCGEIAQAMALQVQRTLRRRGAIVAMSGGIDSSVCAALAVRALGPSRVLGLILPERDSSNDSRRLAELGAAALGIETVVEDIAPALAAAGCYARQDEAIRMVCPEYGEGWKCKISIPSLLDGDRLTLFHLTVMSPTGEVRRTVLPLAAYLQLVAATNFKQRTRAMIAYYHADRLNYAVVGTPNRLEYDQGFFVKGGDGLADLKPIAHLYKTQVYALAAHLAIPEEIRLRPPTTDTYSMPQSQEEFYFSLPYDRMDLCLYGHTHGVPPSDVAEAIGLTPVQVERVYRDIEAKRRATRALHLSPLLVEKVGEI
jgi:NAD+ synthase